MRALHPLLWSGAAARERRQATLVRPAGAAPRFLDRQRGLALVAVMWMVAALMVAVTGVVYAVRGEVRTVSSFREMAVAGAVSDAGIVLAARELAATRDRDSRLARYDAVLDQTVIHVREIPLTGLIDLNAAPEPLLAELIAVAGGIERGQAASLAQRIMDWRDADDQARPAGAEDAAYAAAGSPFRTRGGPFESPEDLLQVLGVDFDLYVRLRPLFTVHQRGGGRVDPAAAPTPVLRVLASGNEQIALDYASAREASGSLADSTRFPAIYVARARTSRFLIEASVQLSNGAYLVSRKVLDVSSWQDGVPWLTLWAERVVESDLPG
jgi:general secretion pathway protein K